MKNQRMLFAKRPFGEPEDECFRLDEADIPELEDNQILVKVCWLSLDPYMRGRMNDVKSLSLIHISEPTRHLSIGYAGLCV